MLPPLRQVITADTSQFDTAIGGATERLRRFAGPAAIGAAVAALGALTRASMNNIDQLTKQARSLGIATDRLQAMSLVAGEAGVSQDQLAMAMGRMQVAVTQLADGTETAKRAFERMGVSLRDLQGLSPDEQFRIIAEGLNNIQDPAERTTAAMEVFGRAGRSMINMLDGYGAKLGEAAEFQRRFGIAVSQEQGEAIERANDAIGRLGMAFEGLGNLLAVTLAPIIEGTAKVIGEIAGAMMDLVVPATDSYTEAQKELNRVLGVYSDTGAPEARDQALELAGAQLQSAEAALAEAKAQQALASARYEAALSDPESAFLVGSEADEATRRLNEAQARFAEIQATIDALRNNTAPIVLPPIIISAGEGEDGAEKDDISAGIPSAAKLQEQMQARLEALSEALQTEAETIQLWYEQGLETLNDALAQELLTVEEYQIQRERLEEEHQRRLGGIRQAGNQEAFSSVVQSGQRILAAVGQTNQRMAKAAQALGQFEAMVNAYRAASQALADPSVPWFLKLSAAASALATGIGFANSIRGMSSSGLSGGGGGAVAGAVSAASGSAAAPQVSRNVAIQLSGGDMFSRSQVVQLINSINEAVEDGAIVRLV